MRTEDMSNEDLIKELLLRYSNNDGAKTININVENINKDNLRLFTIKEVSERLKMNRAAVYELIKSGNLQALKLGSLKVTSLELERFIKEATGKDFSDLENVIDLVCN